MAELTRVGAFCPNAACLDHGKLQAAERTNTTELRGIFGEPDAVLALFGQSTACVERTHLTMRLFNGRLVRQAFGFSKDLACCRASAAWEDAVYNLMRPLKKLWQAVADQPGRRWQPRTPAMAAGLTDHIWTFKELLITVASPNT